VEKAKQTKTAKLLIEYDGSGFSGWQVQPKQRTVQGEIESALLKLTGRNVRITGAGRTDAGVHALGQVACFPVDSRLPEKAYRDGLNALLPDDVRIIKASLIDGKFHARYDAVARSYRYILGLEHSVLRRHFRWCPDTDLNISLMQDASETLLGEHDFTSFCKQNPEESTYRCQVSTFNWLLKGTEIWLEITANRFLHHMVRILVGTLIDVGNRKLTCSDFIKITKARDRTKAGRTAPPEGLYLVSVNYN
jgi:tRNA pseudouridine38-40 synthase